MTPLEKDALLYAKTGKTDKLGDCLSRGVGPNFEGLLFHAAHRGHLETVKLLLSRGTDPNAAAQTDTEGNGPLHFAAYLGYIVMRLLVLSGFVLPGLEALAANGIEGMAARVSASSTAPDHSLLGPVDGDRFSTRPSQIWRGAGTETNWWWEIRFPSPRRVGAILQVTGDHDFIARHSATRYTWLASLDGRDWHELTETRQDDESRCYRLHRLEKAQLVWSLRWRVDAATDGAPALREVEVFDDPAVRVDFPDWIVAVNTTHDPRLPGHGQEFIPLAQSCAGSNRLVAQQISLKTFTTNFLSAEPRPLCAFLSGNFKDWCEVDRESWRGTAGVLARQQLPMWASCGGAQGLAILAETGVDQPWDCPHCRNPQRPRLPIYTHIGHTGQRPCGDYSACVFERGPFRVQTLGADPAFAGMPAEFAVMQSHCGQIEWAPKGWELVATAGKGTLTKTQCLRLKAAPIYAAQFHIEMAGTPETSRQIMTNFLSLARQWRASRP